MRINYERFDRRSADKVERRYALFTDRSMLANNSVSQTSICDLKPSERLHTTLHGGFNSRLKPILRR